MVDLQGPKVRVGGMDSPLPLAAGESVAIIVPERGAPPSAPQTVLPLTRDELVAALGPGDRVLVDDGRVVLRVESVDDGPARAVVEEPGTVSGGDGVTAPGVRAGIAAVTPQDREALRAASASGADLVAQSLVTSAADVEELRAALPDPSLPIVAKIERPDAVEDIDSLVLVSDAVMVARGDLGVETAAREVPVAQKRITRAARQAGIPVVVATEMLESMVDGGRPTRAEASDVANAVFDAVDGVMLSAETAIGTHPVESVAAMAGIVEAAEGSGLLCEGPASAGFAAEATVTRAVASAACELARRLDLAAIVAPTRSGATALAVAAFRPGPPIVAPTPDPAVARRLALAWGIAPVVSGEADGIEATVADALDAARRVGAAAAGDLVAVTGGTGSGTSAATDTVLVRRVP
jgi:pyruvate kinase